MEYTCAGCRTNRTVAPQKNGATPIPKMWKQLPAGLLCKNCVSTQYVTRVATFRVAGVVTGERDDFRKMLREQYEVHTLAKNFVVRTILNAEPPRTEKDQKIPPLPVFPSGGPESLYNRVCKTFPAVAPSLVPTLLKDALSHYRKHRLRAVWLGRQALPFFRFPVPVVVPRAAWRASWLDSGASGKVPGIALALAPGQPRYTLRLARGRNYVRQMQLFQALMDGTATGGTAQVYEKARPGTGDHRPAGARKKTDTMVAIAIQIPKKAAAIASGSLFVRTGQDALLTYHKGLEDISEAQIRKLYCAHIQQAIMAHEKRLLQMACDSKFEKRLPPEKLRKIKAKRVQLCEKHHRRISGWLHEAARIVVNFAQRQGVAEIVYDDTDKSWVRRFPWANLKTLIQNKCAENSIEFRDAGGKTAEDDSA